MIKLIPVFVAIAIVLSLGIAEQFWISDNFGQLEQEVQIVMQKTDQQTITDADMQTLSNWWADKKNILHVFIPHSEIRDIDYFISEAAGHIRMHAYKMAYSQLAMVLDAAKTIPHAFHFKLPNIL